MGAKQPSDPRPLEERLHDELIDAVDEELELEIDDSRLAGLLEHTGYKPAHETLDRHTYFKEFLRLQRSSSNFKTGSSTKAQVDGFVRGSPLPGRAASSSGSPSVSTRAFAKS